jgi:coenzyme F420-reducing hydrogenase delta subunit/NAD-dependent dihydropyrimidine dehydrogenase PreA subunit
LRGESRPRTAEPTTIAELPADAAARVIRIDRPEMPCQPSAQRTANFELIEQGYDEFAAIREASRCLNCAAAATIVSTSRCATCLTCLRICPYEAPHLNNQGEIIIADTRCIACGLCASECPASVIEFKQPGPDSLEADIQQALSQPSDEERPVLGLLCHHATLASLKEIDDRQVKIIKIPCVSYISVNHLLQAFGLGARGVFIAACADDDCRYRDAVYWARLKVDRARRLLSQVGLEEWRLQLYQLTPADSREFYKMLYDFSDRLGANPVKARGGN